MSNKKVGIVTSYLDFDKNYGGVLQAYALSRQIELLGYDARIMPYIYEHIPEDPREKSLFWTVLRALRDRLHPQMRKYAKQKKLHRVMMKFVNAQMPVYRKERIRLRELSEIASDFHAFVCGSDQVWSTRLQQDHCDGGMFLRFVPKGVKKIGYAPSMGATVSVRGETGEEIRESLGDFDAVSVREKTGQSLLRELLGKEVPLVLDPTLLLERKEWARIAKVPEGLPERYIVVYRFGSVPHTLQTMKEIVKKTGLPVIELPSSRIAMEDGFHKRFDIDPGDFIGLVKNAALVLTDSFHATVFSIVNATPFVSFYRQDPSVPFNMNSRLDDLLAMTGLTHRLCPVGGAVEYESLFTVDFAEAHRRIDERRAPSLQYLAEALKGEVAHE